jgi:hypothetical protein
MGYTRYWTIENELDEKTFFKFKEDFKEIVESFKIPLGEFLIDKNSIRFNGFDGDAHETFFLQRKPGFNFCKTQRKPYDDLVCACLELSKYYFKNDIDISSDGKNNDLLIEDKIKSLIRNKKLKYILQ